MKIAKVQKYTLIIIFLTNKILSSYTNIDGQNYTINVVCGRSPIKLLKLSERNHSVWSEETQTENALT